MKHLPGIAIHGGAGTITKNEVTSELEVLYSNALNKCLMDGYSVIENGGSSMDAVTAAVCALEDCELFNAGKGAVFNHEGQHELDASIMCGLTLKAGAVAGVKNYPNPVKIARSVLENDRFVLLSGKGAEEFARLQGFLTQPDSYFYTAHRWAQFIEIQHENTMTLDHSSRKMGTVGAVAIDKNGNLAAATSTGGMTNKQFNRIGDTPLIGSGTFASNDSCAVSCTGHGEYFIRTVTAHTVSSLVEIGKLSLREACDRVVHTKLKLIGGEGGLIAIDKSGNIEMTFNTLGMYRASKSLGQPIKIGIF